MLFTYYGSDGFKVYSFEKNHKLTETDHLTHDSIINVSVAREGRVAALLDKEKVIVYNLESKSTLDIPVVDQTRLVLSPCGDVLFTYRAYESIPGRLQGNPNVSVFSTKDGTLLKSYIHRPNEGWRPQWTSDSSVCVVRVDGEIHVYLENRFDGKPADRLVVKGARHFFLSASPKRPHVALYIPGEKGYPSVARIYQWRECKFHLVTTKSFYRADSARSIWNDRGTDLLVLTSTRSSNESYYGDQVLYFVTTTASADNALVPMPRKGSIYEVVWRPSGEEPKTEDVFVVCYGDPPASVTVFGRDCEPRFDFGKAYCNRLLFNPQGNILLMAGLGNLPGDIRVWDFDGRKPLANYKTNDISTISWFSDGEHLLMATTTPRLRVNNGFGVWHYGGERYFFQRTPSRAIPKPATAGLPASTEHELYEVQILPAPVLPPAPIPKKFGDTHVNPGAQANPPKAYVPPALRNRSAIAKQSAAAMNMPSGLEGYQNANKLPVGLSPSATNTTKSKKRKKPKASGEAPESSASVECAAACTEPTAARSAETKKQITRIRQKLNQIQQLKADQAAGKQLDHNQVDKVASEEQLRAELARLCVDAP